MGSASTVVVPAIGIKRTRVKVCGVCRAADALAAAAAGADAIGLVFYRDSPRAVGVDAACRITRALPPFVARVALFLDAPAADVRAVVEAVRPDVLQFHGREGPAFCAGFGLPYIKTVPMGEGDIDLDAWAHAYHNAQALLLDANRAGQAGGRGEAFRWRGDETRLPLPVIVAGGLNSGNVAEAIRRYAPYAVDVSSGVESAPGIKDAARVRAFVSAVAKAG